MKQFLLFLLTIILTTSLFAQEADTTKAKADSVVSPWTPSIIAGLNVSQIAFNNWAKGGENSLTWTVTGDVGLNYKKGSWELKNTLQLRYGRTKIEDEQERVNDNEIFFENVLVYHNDWVVNPFASNALRTQITTGYEYTDDDRIPVSDFFDPAYITQSVGFTYEKLETIQTRLGLAFQEVITSEYRSYSDDPETLDEIESFDFDTGIESVTDAKYTLAENLLYKSKLRLFSRFDSMDVWDVRWDNTITAKVNSWLNVNFEFLLIHQIDQTLKTQTKQALQVGLVYTIL